MQTLGKLSGLNGEKGLFVATSAPAPLSREQKDVGEAIVKTRWSRQRLEEFSADAIFNSVNSISEVVKSAPEAQQRVSAFTKIVSMSTAFGAKAMFADAFTKCLQMAGESINAKEFLHRAAYSVGEQSFTKGEGLSLSQYDTNAFINNTRSCLNEMFADSSGKLSPTGKKAVSTLMKALESNASNPVLVSGIALHDFIFDETKLPQRLQQSLIADRTIEVANTMTMEKSYEPKSPRPGG